jgi:integrase
MSKREPWSKLVTHAGVEVRIFERTTGGPLWREVKLGRVVSDNGTAYTRKDRRSLGHKNRTQAEDEIRELCDQLATARLTGIMPATLTLGTLFRLYTTHRVPSLSPDRQQYSRACIAMFTEAWGADQLVADIGQQHVDRFVRMRRSGELVPPALKPRPEGEKPGRGHRRAVPVRDGTLHSNLTGWLSPVFNWATRAKTDGGRRLLSANPLHDCTVPVEKAKRRPVASHARYTATQEHTDAVDSTGRLRCILALARYTGRRASAICQLRASDVLLSTERVRGTLAAEGMDERRADHMPHGAIRWGQDADKEGLLFVTALSAAARAELDRYQKKDPRVGDVPLFPAPRRKPKKKAQQSAKPEPEKPITRFRAAEMLIEAERRAQQPKLERGAYHAYRRLWASERKDLPDVDVAAAGGWKDSETMKKSYQQPDDATMLRVIDAS